MQQLEVHVPAGTRILVVRYILSLSLVHKSKPQVSTSSQLLRVLHLLSRQYGWNRRGQHMLHFLSPMILDGRSRRMLKFKSRKDPRRRILLPADLKSCVYCTYSFLLLSASINYGVAARHEVSGAYGGHHCLCSTSKLFTPGIDNYCIFNCAQR